MPRDQKLDIPDSMSFKQLLFGGPGAVACHQHVVITQRHFCHDTALIGVVSPAGRVQQQVNPADAHGRVPADIYHLCAVLFRRGKDIFKLAVVIVRLDWHGDGLNRHCRHQPDHAVYMIRVQVSQQQKINLFPAAAFQIGDGPVSRVVKRID